MEPERLTLTIEGQPCPALAWGDGPLVLALHGFPDLPLTWRHQGPAFARAGFRLVAPTLRGYHPDLRLPDVRVATLARDALAQIEQLGGGPAVILGHDWGAVIAVAAARLGGGSRVRALITLAVPHLGGALGALVRDPAQLLRSAYMLRFQRAAAARAWLGAGDMQGVRTLWARWSPGYEPEPEALHAVLDALRSPEAQTATTAYYRQALRPGAGESWGLMLGEVPCPTLLMMGEDDGCMGWTFAQRAARPEHFPAGLTVLGVPGAGHFAHQERPDVVNDAALAWLQRALRGQSAQSQSGAS
ncbi:alpha/beta hydrolase [Myxococcota bacterium]|nr:alpha/beta hydrolase [Myxococcota bacterium]